ncbi:FAD-dependent oxidoreductase [Alteromonas lipolytica]|uniref:Sarcosine oxidase subunit beta n=1 Tax=Alteromonas lipolytica TaxID=1856405 RepID=A0A1E8FCR0_9ALTE|nr:FAD-dependent oxidoreductase [Alteromonas lipolytica]OFI33283.1 sarcosine oxidase subunit beta [Alteromonas lipolytica]GGF61032.1 sarcosine oxidase subunit beta [Alteromonas lipolytica]
MPFGLLKYGLSRRYPAEPHFSAGKSLKSHYDVVIIGAGAHGAGMAYYLAKYHGITNVALLDKAYLGGGNSARNTAVIRSNYLTETGVNFYKESARLYQDLSNEFGYNIMHEQRGQLTLAHNDTTLRNFRWRAEIGKHLGTNIEMVDRQTIKELAPELNLSENVRFPILAGLWHADGATARHDAIVWGYTKGACERGVELHQLTEVEDFTIENGRVTEVKTNRGKISCGCVVQAVAGHSSLIAAKAGIRLPIQTYPLQAMVTQNYKPLLTPHVSSPQLKVFTHQTSRGEFVIGSGADDYPLYSSRATLERKEMLASAIIELFPFLQHAQILRQWGGIADVTPDYSPIMGLSPLKNYYLNAGWGTYGFKAAPVSAKTMAECVATGKPPALIEDFALERFYRFKQVNEVGATAEVH